LARVPSIYQHLLANATPDSPLPDSPFVGTDPTLPPGSTDSLTAQRIAPRPDAGGVDAVLDALVDLCRRPGDRSRRHVESVMRTRRCIDLVDPLLEAVRSDSRVRQDTLYGEIRKLLTESHWRETVKLCIALLGLYRQEEDAPVLETMGRHEEFTLFATVALGNALADPVPAWLRLAAHTRGWGKVHLVRRLTKHADRPEVRHWLLRYGCANRISANLLALEIATTCALDEALAVPEPDGALLEGARHVLNGLLELGLAPGMAAYGQGAMASLRWVRAMEGLATGLPEFLTLSGLLHWLEKPGHDWPPPVAAELEQRALAILKAPQFAELALADLEHPEPGRAWVARDVARRLGLPVFDRLLPLLRANPADTVMWTYLAAAAGREQLATLLDLSPVGNDEVLGVLIRALRRFPGLGGGLLLRALQSEGTPFRMLACDVLGRWPVASVPPDVALAVLSTAQDDPEGVVRKAARGVLKGWKMPLQL
jgi:hypothetical protein